MFDRGFRTWCETTSLQVRHQLGIGSSSPLNVEALAEYVGVRLLTPEQVQGLSPSSLHTLLSSEKDGWSAITISRGDKDIVIYNSAHSPRRRSSDLTHELAHLLLRHRPSTMHFIADASMALRSYDQKQEEEANWLAGCLLLPRPALLDIAGSSANHAAICQLYNVSSALLAMRLNVSGVNIQVKRRRQRSKG
jgi:hypothetical protein